VFSFDRRNKSWFCSVCIDDTKSLDIYKNKNVEYVKSWRHTELNRKGKVPLTISKEMESNETIVSVDGNRVSDHVREGNFYV
jgi:hypothetical protein